MDEHIHKIAREIDDLDIKIQKVHKKVFLKQKIRGHCLKKSNNYF
jgi:hypothetical protein